MQKAHLHLIKHVLSKGLFIRVSSEVGFETGFINQYQKIKDAVDACDCPGINIYAVDAGGRKKIAWAGVMDDFGSSPDETIGDYTGNSFMDEWQCKYYADCQE